MLSEDTLEGYGTARPVSEAGMEHMAVEPQQRHPETSPAQHAAHHSGHGSGHQEGHGDHVAMFRDRFWWSLLLTIPLVVTSEMVQYWFGYHLDFAGRGAIGPVLGTAVFVYGGWPFLAGGVAEARARRPGMMLLIATAIVVAYTASLATSADLLDLEFWWELGALITIMLLGHWQEMKAVGQAQGALAALAELLPDEAERVTADGTAVVPISARAPGDVGLVRPGGRVPADGALV